MLTTGSSFDIDKLAPKIKSFRHAFPEDHVGKTIEQIIKEYNW